MKSINIAAASDIGRVRRANEDCYEVWQPSADTACVIVADGMGGHKGGQLASRSAISHVRKCLEKQGVFSMDGDLVPKALETCIISANEKVFLKSLEETELVGMGTTMVLCVIREGRLYAANVGDSRLYLVRNGIAEQITKDHSVVQELLDAGSITYDQMKQHPQKHVITRAIGSERSIAADTFSRRLTAGDTIIVCSDGLTNLVSDQELAAETVNYTDVKDNVTHLIALANERGGSDNITAAVIRL
ncbi:MAG: Stp1/IreP family PP2C-type Ser/Thr phosphatase [Ruminococcaceae bacterium]|nr:Stp1/IreP family PP2C-type Ser/Thr phosphatase [Oscillospiraceae bacterium]